MHAYHENLAYFIRNRYPTAAAAQGEDGRTKAVSLPPRGRLKQSGKTKRQRKTAIDMDDAALRKELPELLGAKAVISAIYS
jgi:hypothetical protein